jgi:uncharacterized protein
MRRHYQDTMMPRQGGGAMAAKRRHLAEYEDCRRNQQPIQRPFATAIAIDRDDAVN